MTKLIASLIITSVVFSFSAQAARIAAVKDKRVLIMAEGESYSVGQRIPLRDSSGKLRAVVQIAQIKDQRIIAQVVKGRADKNLLVGSASAASSNSASGRASSKGKKHGAFGIMAGFSQNKMAAKTNLGDVSMSGTSFNLAGFYQINLSEKVNARLLGGYETLSASGTTANGTCPNSTPPCTTDISYIGFQGLLKYNMMMRPSFDFWIGGGLGFLFAIAKSSNILDTSKVSTNQTITGVIGLDWKLSNNRFVPLQFDYSMFPDSSGSAASQMILRAGYGWEF